MVRELASYAVQPLRHTLSGCQVGSRGVHPYAERHGLPAAAVTVMDSRGLHAGEGGTCQEDTGDIRLEARGVKDEVDVLPC